MMKQMSRLVLCFVSFGIMLFCSGFAARAAENSNFSGRYQSKDTRKSNSAVILRVTQSDATVEVSKEINGKEMKTTYPLNGSEGDYLSSGGAQGKCKAGFKGKSLSLETLVVTRPQPSGAPMRVHTREVWQLSGDAKTLTVKTSVDFPDAPPTVSGLVGDSLADTERYVRIENP
jgi:hypothetical protein